MGGGQMQGEQLKKTLLVVMTRHNFDETAGNNNLKKHSEM